VPARLRQRYRLKEDSTPTILVVEDYEDIRTLIRAWLEGRGYRVVEAHDGAAAVEIARRECPDIVLMDMSMPNEDGITATQRIHQIEELCDVPIVACSAHAAQEWADKALAAGCAEYLMKPIDFIALDEIQERLLPSRGMPSL
jgi:two-component system cell cycle response regulator DivK